MNNEVLVEEYRGDILECVHTGHICGMSVDGNIKYSVGDPDFVAYLRSSAKPIQAIPIVKRGIDAAYGFTDKEITILTGSHRAERFHVDAIEGIMKKIDIDEEALVCLPTYPLGVNAMEQLLRENRPKRRIYHNCSGKHLGILTLCKYLGYPIDNYWAIEHPAQQEILDYISEISGYTRENIGLGVDGCGVPVFAMPMKYLANTFLRLACPDLIENKAIAQAVTKITDLMNKNYEMVSGTNRICSLLLMDKNIVAKGGAKGVYCFGLREEKLGFAIKIMDGSEDEWPFIVAAILENIDYKNKSTIKRLYDTFPIEIKNDNNKIVGYNKVVFEL